MLLNVLLLTACALACATSADAACAVSNLRVDCRAGQAFVRWDEQAANTRRVSVYMSREPITAAGLAQSTLLTSHVEPHSASDWIEDPEGCIRGSGKQGWVLRLGTKPIDTQGGLFVHTVAQTDPEQAYFAVTETGEVEPGVNSLTKPVALTPGLPEPIWQGGGQVDRGPAEGKPMVLRLHAKRGRPSEMNYLAFGDGSLGWREGLAFKFRVRVTEEAVSVEPFDRTWINRRLTESWDSRDYAFAAPESMWYGMNSNIFDPELKMSGTPTDYTQRRVLWIMDWVQRTYGTDPNRVYAFGSSMGTGALHLAMWHPERFASVDVHVPFIDGSYQEGAESNAKRFEPFCGPMSLMCSDGMPLGERLNLVKCASERPDDLPFVSFRAGRNDSSVFWKPKPAFIRAMQGQRHGLLACWDDGSHGTAMRKLPYGVPKHGDHKWYMARFAINKSYPAFSNFAPDDDPGNGEKTDGDIEGCVNRGLDWKDIVDEGDRYEITVFLDRPDAELPLTVDMTPRRRQRFLPAAAGLVRARNIAADGTTIQTTDITVDQAGRITYEGFMLTSVEGNRLVITGG